MDDGIVPRVPPAVPGIILETEALGFNMASEPRVGALLEALATSKPAGRLLELGTGTGHGTAWLLSGMDSTSSLDTVDSDPQAVSVARRHLSMDQRVTFHVEDGAEFIRRARQRTYDFIFADAWPGKFSHLDIALALLRPGGIYLIDDLLPQPNWGEDHASRIPVLMQEIERRDAYTSVRLAWASGLLLVVRKPV